MTEIPADKLAAALLPIPIRQHYHQGDDDSNSSMLNSYGPQRFPSNQQQNMQAATPAPTPPPSPKPKKQQYQTDQTRPFLFPFSRVRGSHRLVPFAIDEADGLYARHMHVSLSLYQMWRTREDFILDESGLQSLPRSESEQLGPGGHVLTDRKFSIVSLPSQLLGNAGVDSPNLSGEEESETAFPDVLLLDRAIEEAEQSIKTAEHNGDRKGRRKAQERRADLLRLKRVEIIYVSLLKCLDLVRPAAKYASFSVQSFHNFRDGSLFS